MNSLERLLNHDSSWWFLHEIKKNGDGLEIRIVEGITGALRNEELVEGVFHEVSPIEVTYKSRIVIIKFDNMVAFNWMDESYSPPDDTEIHITQRVERGYHYQIAVKAEFLDFANNGYWGSDFNGVLQLFRICTLNDVIEVASSNEPTYTVIYPDKSYGLS